MTKKSPGHISLQYADFLPTQLERKRYLGHYPNRDVIESGPYEADQGWDSLFTDYLAARAVRKEIKAINRAGATAKDIPVAEREVVHNGAREEEYAPETTDRMTREAIDDTLRK